MNGDRNMKETDLRFHTENINGYERFILEKKEDIRRIELQVGDHHDAREDSRDAELEDILGRDVGGSSFSDTE